MCALTSLEYEFLVENILSKKKMDIRKLLLKDHNGNRQQMHLSEACRRWICLVWLKKVPCTYSVK